MKRFRIKIAGFGLAVLAGSSVASAEDWRPAGASTANPVRAASEPGLLPTSFKPSTGVRGEPGMMEPLWFAASPRAETRPVVTANAKFTRAAISNWSRMPSVVVTAAGPRVGAIPPVVVAGGTEAVLDTPEPAFAAQGAPKTQPGGALPPPRDLPPPRVVPDEPWKGTQPPPMPQPTPPPPNFYPKPPTPQGGSDIPPTLPSNPGPELPVAPPELMFPAQGVPVPGKHGTFGSAPVRLSRDYPALSDLYDSPRFGSNAAGSANGDAVIERGYVQAEFLLWFAKGMNTPVLGTASTNNGFGFLGDPGTVPIIGPGNFLGAFRPGFRVRGGTWFDDCGSCGIDGSFFSLGRKTADARFNSITTPIITRPIFSPNPNGAGGVIGEIGEAVTVPGILTGSLSVHAVSEMWGFDANLRKCLVAGCDARATWFAGYRNVNLKESLAITENINVIGVGGSRVLFNDPIGSAVVVQDRFATRNHFHGAQLGGTYERRWGRMSVDARASVALGVTHQDLDISGFQVRNQPGRLPMTFQGGLLAAGPNLGSFNRDKFSVVPEATVNLGYWVTPTLKLYAGYNFLYWSNVIRPGDQIDRVVDLNFVPNAPAVASSGQLRPRPLFNQSNLWVHGLQLGLEWRW